MRLIRSSFAALAVCGVLALAACGSDDDSLPTTTAAGAAAAAGSAPASTPASSPATTGGAVALENTTWTLSDAELGADLGTVDVTMRLAGGTVSGSSGCNRFTGTYTTDGQSLTISPGLASTMMACPDPQMAVEQAFLQLLPKVASYEVEGDTLVLSDASGEPLLVFEQVSGEDAVTGDWVVTAVRTATAVSSPVPGSELTLSLHDGTASGSAGCNQFNGGYQVTGETLTFGQLVTTRKACEPAVNQQETDYLAALAATTTFSSTSQMLTLLAADGTITVTLMRADPSASSVPTT